MFDGYMVVDWSAASKPKRGKDSIWVAWYRDELRLLENPATRHEAVELCRELMLEHVDRGERLLAGFDFSFAFPAGTAQALGVDGWRGLWEKLARDVQDDAANGNQRFGVAAAWNRRISGRPAPFWGCPASAASPWLSPRRPRQAVLPEKRLCERRARAKSTWQLFYNGSVGSQALLGTPRLEQLRQEPKLDGAVQVWPLETGFRVPAAEASVTLAEVYPSLLEVQPEEGEVRDAAQVRTLAAWFAELDVRGELRTLLGPPASLSEADRALAEGEEGWILGVR